MSGLDPAASLISATLANAQISLQEAALDLGALIQEFRAQIAVGEILTATVLPPENGADRLSLLGQTITAQIPPGINPGETLALQVTGFTSTAIIVRNLGAVDPSQPLPEAPPLPQSAVDGPQQAILASRPPQPPAPSLQQQPAQQSSAPQPQAPQTQSPSAQTPPVAPPREIFVAASVQSPQTPATKPQGTAPEIIVIDDETLPPQAAVEARIVASRAQGQQPPLATPRDPRAPVAARTPAPPPVAPQGTPLTTLLKKDLVPPVLVRQSTIPAAQGRGAPAPAPAPAAATPEGALLTRLRVPLSGTTLAAARLVETATQSVTTAYDKLDTMLAKLAPEERVSSLRAMLSFVSRVDMRNVRAMPEQIASYVSNVVTGAESKIAQIVRAWSQGAVMAELPVENAPPSNSTASGASPAASTPQAAAQGVSPGAPGPALPDATDATGATGIARAAERAVALQHDVKSALLELVANPPSDAAPQVVQALREALTATTAVQLNTLNSQQNSPNAITIALPAYFHEGGKPAQLRISKDAQGGKNGLDADNFHIAFLLDTQSLGTVAIDLRTAERQVRLDVRTEAGRVAERFRSTLSQLGERLESMHYRVSSMSAAVATRANEPVATAETTTPKKSDSNVDAKA